MKTTEFLTWKVAREQEERACLWLLPTAVKLTRGFVEHAELLLEDAPDQPFLGNRNACRLIGSDEAACVLLDFGREVHGSLRLTVSQVESGSGRAGLRIRFGESVMEALTPLGQKNTTNDHAVRDHVYDIGQYSTTQTGETGFRFALIQLESPEAKITIQAVHLCFIFRDIPYLGSFSCSDALLDTIWKTAAYTVHLNMQNYLWDGIKRDRLAWQGDMHTEVLTIENVFGANPVVSKTMDYLRDGTRDDEWINGYSSYSLWWMIVQAEWYRYTGDLDYLSRQRAFLKAQTRLALAQIDPEGAEALPAFRFLDWPNLENGAATHAGLQSILILALEDAAFLLRVLGETEQAVACESGVRRLRTHVPPCGGSKQAAAMLSLSGLGSPEVLNREVIAPCGARGYSTFMGYYLLSAKAKAGDMEGALRDLRAYWGGMLDLGATTFWEDFNLDWMKNAGRIDELVPEGKRDVHGDYGAHCYQNFRHSLCHGWSSGPVPFLTRHVLGVQIAAPGCQKLRIQPNLGDLDWAEGSVPTPYGLVRVRHTRREDGSIRTEYTAPEGVEIIL